MSYKSETDFFCSGIRPKEINYVPMEDKQDMMWMAPINIDNFTKNEGADYLLHIGKKEFTSYTVDLTKKTEETEGRAA